ncbi:protein of unknown function DUF1120 [Burkholderia sp. lig30]|uniref:DUF1120 domain-containing protein n=1 Tax=Burkholderia sp. lig30 TaxID=1192124 RepID=UPI0004611378|nr:DUF1120 domain-containing protein [Burkholderia sp. lig30]KDB06552.1 protein of unknown function DUF1120 [Burkholderia sp. lig30]
MKTRFALPLFACALLHAPLALAGTDLNVKGRIAVGACALTMLDGGIFDFGKTSHSAANGADAGRTAKLSVDCASPTKFAFRLIDNRADMASGSGNETDFGLGGPDGTSAGHYRISIINAHDSIIDRDRDPSSSNLWLRKRLPGGQAWTSATIGRYFPLTPNAMYGMTSALAPSSSPDALVRMRLTLLTTLGLAPDIDRGKDLELDGSATVELHYL